MKIHPTQKVTSFELQVRANVIAACVPLTLAKVMEHSGLTEAQALQGIRSLLKKGWLKLT